ncbi:MAG TPA: metallophosphoesterase [Pirellulales bacterium]|jgi:predicted MPP superfamily phosphohydrolase|nr:metallophosphoesterase [Pirellulales bacterium]
MRCAWLTDLHLDFLPPDEIRRFLDGARDSAFDVALLGGDLSEARDLVHDLRTMAQRWPLPIYFVLGNHDFYYGSIRHVRQRVAELCEELPNLHYLTCGGVVRLSAQVGLLGHDGWADARLGDYETSFVMMNDYKLIEELAAFDKEGRWSVLNALGDEAADHVRRWLPEAMDQFAETILLTHVPPFREACWHEGQVSNDEWLPHFSCRAVGDAILEVMQGYPHRQLTVLCGHTHSSGEYRPRENILVLTGGTKYGHPSIQRIMELE